MNYQYLYFNNEWINTNKIGTVKEYITQDSIISHTGPEEILMDRTRHRLGVQLMMGNVIPSGNNFAIEVYYGLGVRGIFSTRFDEARKVTEDGKEYIGYLNFEDKSFYLRPTIHAGIKLKLGW